MPARKKLHEQIMGEVLAAIVSGEYPEGSRLPKETELAKRHDVSRYVARECIQALRDRGVLTVKHGVGTTILPRDGWYLFDPVLLEAMLEGPEAKDVTGEAQECRAILWPEVAAAAAARRSEDDLERLRAAAEDPDAFHAALLGAARNRFLRHVLAALDHTAPDAATGGGDARGLERVLEAVEAGDADAAREAMTRRLGGRTRGGRSSSTG